MHTLSSGSCTFSKKIYAIFPLVKSHRGWGDIIRSAREAKGWTQAEFAERVRSSATTVSRWETEHHEPSIEQLNDISAALNLSLDDLLRKMGARLTPPLASELPADFVAGFLRLPQTQRNSLTELVIQATSGGGRAPRR